MVIYSKFGKSVEWNGMAYVPPKQQLQSKLEQTLQYSFLALAGLASCLKKNKIKK